jgi:mRNA-degrading endonuclease RelE of RelBE toxin-antitoxin system
MSPRHRGEGRPFQIDYAEQAKQHLKDLPGHKRARVVDAVELRLSFEPAREDRNRKKMDENSLEAGFELRVADLRVYYDVDESHRVVHVLAIAEKHRERILIGGEEIVL